MYVGWNNNAKIQNKQQKALLITIKNANVRIQKKGLRRVPTFVNLKSNTMKNIAKIHIFSVSANNLQHNLHFYEQTHIIY